MYRRVAMFALAMAAFVAAVGIGTGSASAQAGPIAVIGGPYSGQVGYPIQFNASGSSGTNLTFAWNFGDGTTGQGPVVTKVYSAPNTYTVTVTVSSAQGGTSTATTQVAVGANPGYVPGTNQCHYGGCGYPAASAPAQYSTCGWCYQQPVYASYVYNPCGYNSCVGSYSNNYNPCGYNSCVRSSYNYNPCGYNSCVGSYYNNYNPCTYRSCVGSYYNNYNTCNNSCVGSYYNNYNQCNNSCVGSYYTAPTYHQPVVKPYHHGGCVSNANLVRYNITSCIPVFNY